MLSCIVDLMKRAPRSKTIGIYSSFVHAVGRYLGLVHVAVTTSNLLGFLAVVVLIRGIIIRCLHFTLQLCMPSAVKPPLLTPWICLTALPNYGGGLWHYTMDRPWS